MKHFFFAFLFILLDSCLRAAIRLVAFVGDNIDVANRFQNQSLGRANPGEKINIQFQGKQLNTKAGKDGKTLVLPPFSAGGPYEMVIKRKNTITIQDILIGHV